MSILDQKPKSALKEGFGRKFGIGLVVALSLSLAAFQITAPYSTEKPLVPYTFEGDDVFNIQPISSHKRTSTPEPTKPTPIKPVNIVIGEPDPTPGPEPIAALTFDPFAPIPDEDVYDAPIPKKLEPTRHPEKMPEFPGGTPALLDYLGGTPFCDAARTMGYEGKVHVQFIVDTDGSIKDVQVLNKLFPCLDQAVAARIKHMPKWKPGYMGNRAVPVIMVAPINFKLQ